MREIMIKSYWAPGLQHHLSYSQYRCARLLPPFPCTLSTGHTLSNTFSLNCTLRLPSTTLSLVLPVLVFVFLPRWITITNTLCCVATAFPLMTLQFITSFRWYLLHINKSIWLSLPPMLYVTNWFTFFSKKVLKCRKIFVSKYIRCETDILTACTNK